MLPADDAELGDRLRSLRTERGMSLRALAAELGLSPSALSQMERGALRPSVTRLFQILSVLDVSLSAAFGDNDTGSNGTSADDTGDAVVVTRAEDVPALPLGDGVTYRRLTPVPVPGAEVYETVYPPGAGSAHDAEYLCHTGHEMGTVTSGRLTVDLDGERYELGPGDGMRFPSTTPHRIRNDGAEPAVAVWITVP